MTNTVFQRFKLNISSISHQQTIAKHRDLPNTEIFQSKDFTFDICLRFPCLIFIIARLTMFASWLFLHGIAILTMVRTKKSILTLKSQFFSCKFLRDWYIHNYSTAYFLHKSQLLAILFF
jgi:hypothetical protein